MQVSHSRVETFVKCPYQFKLRYIDKLETYFNGDPANPLVIGTALHTAIEKDLDTAIKEYYANYPVITDKNIEEAIKIEKILPKCLAVLPPLDNAIFELELNCPEFKGFIDLLVPVEPPKEDYGKFQMAVYDDCEWYDMYDFKYSNNVRNYMESGQLHEYKFFFEKLNPKKRIRNMYFLFAPKVAIRMKYKNKTNKRDETLEEFRKRLDAELEKKEAQLVAIHYDTDKVKEFLRNAKDCRMATSYPKNPTRLCDWCEFQKYCEESEDLEIMNLPKNERRTVAASDKKKIWLYGAPFSGKTYLANEFPDPLMLNTDGNIKYIDAPFIAIKDVVTQEGRITKRTFAWQVFKDAIAELEKKQNDFKTIVVDLLEDTYEYCRLYMYDQLGITHESDDSFRAWDKIRTEFLSTIKRLMNLDYDNIILISHEDTSKDLTKKSGDKVSAIKPNIQDKAALKIAGMVDLVARVIADDDKRILSFKTNEVIFGGGRLTMRESEIPCDYDELCAVYEDANKDKKPAMTGGRKAYEKAKAKMEAEKTAATEEVETADAPPVETETAVEPPKRKARRKKEEAPAEEPKTPDSGSIDPETAENTADKTTDDSTEKAESPRRRRRKTAEPAEETKEDVPFEEDKAVMNEPVEEEAPKRRRRRRVEA